MQDKLPRGGRSRKMKRGERKEKQGGEEDKVRLKSRMNHVERLKKQE